MTTQSLGEDAQGLVPMTLLRVGQSGKIGEVISGGVVHRLREMGLRVGAKVQMIRAGSRSSSASMGRKFASGPTR